jgi:hypothetical protein
MVAKLAQPKLPFGGSVAHSDCNVFMMARPQKRARRESLQELVRVGGKSLAGLQKIVSKLRSDDGDLPAASMKTLQRANADRSHECCIAWLVDALKCRSGCVPLVQ